MLGLGNKAKEWARGVERAGGPCDVTVSSTLLFPYNSAPNVSLFTSSLSNVKRQRIRGLGLHKKTAALELETSHLALLACSNGIMGGFDISIRVQRPHTVRSHYCTRAGTSLTIISFFQSHSPYRHTAGGHNISSSRIPFFTGLNPASLSFVKSGSIHLKKKRNRITITAEPFVLH